MSQSDYDAKLQQIQSIPRDTIKRPHIPVDIYLQEAVDLEQWCQQDKPAFLDTGFDWSLVDDLPQRIGALRQAQSIWQSDRFEYEQAQLQWKQESPNAYALRDQLLRAMRYAYRDDADLLKRVADITAGTGHADMIQDLSDIAALGRANLAPLLAINLKPDLLDQANSTADAMATLLAQANGESAGSNTSREVRDRAYTLLKQAVDDIRVCGQYALWGNDQRRDGYFSDYRRRSRRSAATQVAPSAESTSPA